jgi:hypothetical protein
LSKNVPSFELNFNAILYRRERDFSCCGWESYMDYAIGNFTDLPESCCQQVNEISALIKSSLN